MKNYIFEEDEDSFEEDEIEQAEVDGREQEILESKNCKNTKNCKNIKGNNKKLKDIDKDVSVFDENLFDAKVARTIVKIHKKDNHFSNWVEKNIYHLKSLYKLSGLQCSFVDFSSCIYENTYKD
jgi:hypothetical protein